MYASLNVCVLCELFLAACLYLCIIDFLCGCCCCAMPARPKCMKKKENTSVYVSAPHITVSAIALNLTQKEGKLVFLIISCTGP